MRDVTRPFHVIITTRFQVTEKCPSCGHMEAYSKELQVRGRFLPVFNETGLIPRCSCAVQTKARPFCTPYALILLIVERLLTLNAVCEMQTRLAYQQLSTGLSLRPDKCIPSSRPHSGVPYLRSPGPYRYTPTELKRATTPKPPRTLAVEATANSRMGTADLGRLLKRVD